MYDLNFEGFVYLPHRKKQAKVGYTRKGVKKSLVVDLKPGEGEKDALIFAEEYMQYLNNLEESL